MKSESPFIRIVSHRISLLRLIGMSSLIDRLFNTLLIFLYLIYLYFIAQGFPDLGQPYPGFPDVAVPDMVNTDVAQRENSIARHLHGGR